MFIARQRNFIFNISEFIRENQKDVNNSLNIEIINDFNTFDKSRLKVIKLSMFHENCLKFKN